MLLASSCFGGAGGWRTWGISTKTLKIFLPVPSYFVSSLAFSKSRCSVGSSDDEPLGFLTADRVLELLFGVGGGWLDNSDALGIRVAAEVVPSGAPPPKNDEKRITAKTKAIAPSTAAITNFVRFSAPTFTTLSSNRFQDRKSTRLNSSHLGISYAVFCLK